MASKAALAGKESIAVLVVVHWKNVEERVDEPSLTDMLAVVMMLACGVGGLTESK